MPLIIPAGYAQCVVEHIRLGDTEPMLCTFGVELDELPAGGEAGVPDAVMEAWIDSIGSGYNLDTSVTGVTVYVGGGSGGTEVYTSSLSPFTGPNSNALVPQNTAILIRKRTDLAGKRGRGRLYIPEVPEGSVDAVGTLVPADRAAWQARASALLANLTTAEPGWNLPMVVLHRSEGAGVEPPPTPVLNLVVESKVATQRRRLRP